MYQYSFDDDTTKIIEQNTKDSQNILQKFSDVDNKYNTLAKSGAKLKLEKLSYSEPDAGEIIQRAENNLKEYKDSGISAIQDKYTTKLDQIAQNQQNAQSNLKSDMAQIEKRYDTVKENVKNDAVQRGLARSSIVVNMLNSVDMQKIADLKMLESTANSKIANLSAEIDSLEVEKQSALSSFNIAYAVKLQNEIDSISTEIEKNKQSVIKYNNEVDSLMAKWQKQQEDDEYDKITKLAKLANEYGSTVFDTLKQNEKYAIASEHFAQMSKQDALSELTNNSVYLTALGKINYNKLLAEINNR